MDAALTPAQPSLATRAATAFMAYRRGETDRMSELVDLMTPILWHTARAQRADPVTAEDAVQTAWLRLVDRADSISDPQAVMQWLIITVRRETWRLVGQGRRDLAEAELSEASDDADVTNDPEAVSILSERQRTLWRHVASLSERCRELLRVVAFADRPDYAALATALGMPVGSIGPTRGRCLQKLRNALQTDASWGISDE